MTVQDLIDRLSNIEDKSQRVVINLRRKPTCLPVGAVSECIGSHKVYDVNEIVGADIPKDDVCKEYERGILISNV